MNDRQQQILWLGATRYYLSHSMHAVSDFCGLLIAEWNSMDKDIKAIIKYEISEAIKTDNNDLSEGALFRRIGYSIDRAEWDRVCKLWSDNK